ncbi:endo-1,4-beta-xylanase [Heliocybe sulcata]|uniref:Beta-xylanase n=1 Tax=Heliocybe sulcata TaxID=5364 RepID=A0A5C3N088_9AGAM|nr:endo-1,4-beta-xylanase [Heliocybe sulcata]
MSSLLAFSLLLGNALSAWANPLPRQLPSFGTLKAAAAPRYFGAALGVPHLMNFTHDPLFDVDAVLQFSGATPENEMKWMNIEPERNMFNFTGGDIVAAFANANDYTLRGHNLVWYSQLAPWVETLTGEDLWNATVNHITTVMTHYKEDFVLYCWDVVNEAFNDDGTYRENVWYTQLGPDYIPNAYTVARSVNSGSKLYINDYNTEGINNKSDALLTVVQSMKAQNLVDGVGFQCHFIVGELPPDLEQNFARFVAAGVEIAITELDIRMNLPPSEADIIQQAKDYTTVVNACLAQGEACVGITTWGITDLYSWVPSTFSGTGYALLFDDNYVPKPAYNSTIYALQGLA